MTQERSAHSVWIGNLNFGTRGDTIRELLGGCGTITRVFPEEGEKGYMFVDFDCAEAVQSALNMSETELDGRQIKIRDANAPKEGKRHPENSLFVRFEAEGSNLSKDIFEEEFKRFGDVKEVRLINDRDTNELKGIAFVDFQNEQDAKAALDHFKQHQLNGQNIKVDISKPKRDDNRRGGKGGKGFYGGHGRATGGYGGNRDGYGGNRDGYGGNRDGYGGNRDGYGGNRDGYGGNRDGYGGNRDGYGGNRDRYGGERSSHY